MSEETDGAVLSAIGRLETGFREAMLGFGEGLSRLDGRLSGFDEGLSRLDERLSRFDEGLSRLDERFSGFDEGLSRLDERLSGFDRRFSGVEERLSRVETQLVSLRSDLMARMDRLQDKLSGVTDDLTVNYSAAEQSERMARNAMEETRGLAEIVSAMQRQIRRISAKVFGFEDDTH